MAQPYNILMYSHDTYGLGHIRRTMAIANHLRGTNTNILILTGSPLAGRFALPSQVDFVRIPGMIKKTNDEYRSLSIKIEDQQALSIRTNIILATAQTFEPDLFIVDKEPLGLKREVLPTLEWLKQTTPRTRTVLGLRDILDDPEVISADWQARDIYSYLAPLYDDLHGRLLMPLTFKAVYEDGVELTIRHDTDNGILFEGTEGRIFVNRGRLAGRPVDDLRSSPLPEGALEKVYKDRPLTDHLSNFFQAVVDRTEPISDPESHHRALSTCHLAGIAARLGRKIKWDPTTETIQGDPQAQSFVAREKRKGFEIEIG